MAFCVQVARCASRGRRVTRPGGVADLGLGISSETQREGRTGTTETKALGREMRERGGAAPGTRGTVGAGAGVAGDTAGDLNIRLCHTRGAADNFITSAYKNDCRGMQMARASRPPAPAPPPAAGPEPPPRPGNERPKAPPSRPAGRAETAAKTLPRRGSVSRAWLSSGYHS